MAALSTIAKVWKVTKCPSTDEWIKKNWYVYTMEYYPAIKKNKILPFTTMWMELECIMLSEKKSARERQISYDFTHMWNLRYKTDEHKGREAKIISNQRGRQTIRDSNTAYKLRVARGVLGGGMG